MAPSARLLNILMQSNAEYALSIISNTQLATVIQELILDADSRRQQLGIDVCLAAMREDICLAKLM